MPIVFAQPDPISPAISAGYGAAEFAAKTFPSIAQIYESAARLRAQGGGGGQRYGGGNSSGQIQVLPSGDGGAGLYQVEAQANREQRALDLGFEAQQDPVARHIAMTAQYKQQAADAEHQAQNQQLAQLNPMLQKARGQGPQGPAQTPEPPPTTWDQSDDQALAGTMQGISDLRDKYNSGAIDTSTYYQTNGPLQAQRDQLVAKQRQSQEDAKKEQTKEAMTDQANARGLLNLDMTHAGQNGYKQIPDLITPIYDIDKHTGKKYMVNAEEFKANAHDRDRTKEYNNKIDLAKIAAAPKDEHTELKEGSAQYHQDLDAATKRLQVKDKDGHIVNAGNDAIEAERVKISAGREAALEPVRQQQRIKHADPKALGEFTSISQTDPNKMTDQQLARVAELANDPKRVALSDSQAAILRQSIAKIMEARRNPPALPQSPAPRDHDAPLGARKGGAPMPTPQNTGQSWNPFLRNPSNPIPTRQSDILGPGA